MPDPIPVEDECCTPDPCLFQIKGVAPVKIDISELTSGGLNGDGVYDKLLGTLRANLQAEYDAGHITQKEFSNILLNSIPVLLQQGIAFSISKARQAYELDQLQAANEAARHNIGLIEAQKRIAIQQSLNAETEGEILRSQAEKADKEVLLMGLEIKLKQEGIRQVNQAVSNAVSEGVLIKSQIDGVLAETDVKKYQLCQIMPEEKKSLQLQHKVTTNQAVSVAAQTAQTNMQTQAIVYDLKYQKPVEVELLRGQTKKLAADTLLAGEQLKLAGKEILLREAEILIKTAELGIANRQLDLYEQKLKTERAQIDGTIIGEGSVLDASIKLQQAQTKAYDQDQVIKATKLLMDSFAVQYQEGDKTGNSSNLQDDTTLGKFVQKLGASISVPLNPI